MAEVQRIKCCCRCRVKKPIFEFGTSCSAKDGRSGHCLACSRAYHAARRKGIRPPAPVLLPKPALPDVPGVEFRIIDGHPNYAVSSDGFVWGCLEIGSRGRYLPNWRRLCIVIDPRGYPRVILCSGGRRVSRPIHWIVVRAFLGPKPDGMECCHRDGDKRNNSVANLRWGTHAENMRDMVEHGRSRRGERSGGAKLTAEQVLAARRRMRSGETPKSVARDLGITPGYASRLKNGDWWSWLKDEQGE